MNNIRLNGTQEFMGISIPVIEGGFGEDCKCISDKTISEIHGQPNREIRRRILDNIKRFKENVDYIDLNKGVGESHTLDLTQFGYTRQAITQANNIYLLSERGYAKLIKIMDTDLAWEIHDKLMDEYFSMRKVIKENSAYQLPQDYLSALKALVQSEEEKALMQPQVEYYQKVLNPNAESEQQGYVKYITVTAVAKDLKMSAQKLNKILHDLHIVYKQSNTWYLYAEHENRIPEYADYTINEHGQTLKFSEKGREWIISLLEENEYIDKAS